MSGMRYGYPARIEGEEGDWVVTFRDVPEALTGDETVEKARALAQDCLIAALGFYTNPRWGTRPIPRPSRPEPGEEMVDLPPLVAAKLALHEAVRDARLATTALAERLGVPEAAVRRLLDLDHRSHIGEVERALALLGKRLVVEVLEAA